MGWGSGTWSVAASQGSMTWTWTWTWSASGFWRNVTGCGFWTWSERRSGTETGNVSGRRNVRTWRIGSWSEMRSGLGFWTGCVIWRGRCFSSPGPCAAVLASWLERTHRGHSAPSPHCSLACHGRADCRRPPQLRVASHWEAWGVAGGCLWGPEACTHDPPASQGGPLTPLEDRSRAHWGLGWGHHG